MIATPCAHGVVSQHYATTVFQIGKLLSAMSIDSTMMTLGSADIVFARNYIASWIVANPAYSHLLFIDSDMNFRSELIRRMFDFDAPMVSAVYPRRSLDLKRLLRDAKLPDGSDQALDQAIFRSLDYNIRAISKGGEFTFETRKGFLKVAGTGMGICLIRREVLDRMIAGGAARRHVDAPGQLKGGAFPYYGFFDPLPDETGYILAEDLSFCRRWVEDCGGELWACIDEVIGHHGDFNVQGRFADRLTAGRL